MNPYVVCFDLEGPLSPQDNAYEVMALVPDGNKIFEVISRYDDFLAMENRKDYEPGDTLSLIVPFLVYHDITEDDIRRVSNRAGIVDGVKETIASLREMEFEPYIISTSYEQHAHNVGGKIGISKGEIYCTKLPLTELKESIDERDLTIIEDIENLILEELHPNLENEATIKEPLDKFFWEDLQKTSLETLMQVKVVGGARKVDAMLDVAKRTKTQPKDLIAVGDSITDYKMLGRVRYEGGIAVAFNGNGYSVPYGNVGLASPDMRLLLPVADAFSDGGKERVIELVGKLGQDLETNLDGKYAAILDEIDDKHPGMSPQFNCLEDISDEEQKGIIDVHKKMRKYVRGAAGNLG